MCTRITVSGACSFFPSASLIDSQSSHCQSSRDEVDIIIKTLPGSLATALHISSS